MNKLLFTLLVLISFNALSNEEQSYCDYTMEKSEADRMQLIAPNLVVGAGKNSASLENIMTVGITESLSHYLKGQLQKDIGAADCKLFRTMNQLTKHTSYDAIILSNAIGLYKMKYLKVAIKHLSKLVLKERELVKKGASTIITVEFLKAAKTKLELKLIELQQQVDSRAIPALSKTPVDQLIKQANSQMALQQKRLLKSNKYNNWDITLAAGAGKDLSTTLRNSTTTPYVSLNFIYSLGAMPRNRALQRSAKAYTQYAKEQSVGPIQLATLFIKKVASMIKANKLALISSRNYEAEINESLKSIEGIDNAHATRFKTQLIIEKINNSLEKKTLEISNVILMKYLHENFSKIKN